MNSCLICSVKNVLVISIAIHRSRDFIFDSYCFSNGLVSKLGGSSAEEALLPPNLDTRNWILTLKISLSEPLDLKNGTQILAYIFSSNSKVLNFTALTLNLP